MALLGGLLDVSVTVEGAVYYLLYLLAGLALLLPMSAKWAGRVPGWAPLGMSVACAVLVSMAGLDGSKGGDLDVVEPVFGDASRNTGAFIVAGMNTTSYSVAASLPKDAMNNLAIPKNLLPDTPLSPAILGAAIAAAAVGLLLLSTMAFILRRRRGWFVRRTGMGNAVVDMERMIEIYGSKGVGRGEYQSLSTRLYEEDMGWGMDQRP